jgi:HEAT repeat protein
MDAEHPQEKTVLPEKPIDADANYGPNRRRSASEREKSATFFLVATAATAIAVVGDFLLCRSIMSFELAPNREPQAILLHYLLIALAAIAQAMWADSHFLHGAFRQRIFASKKKSGDDDSLAAQHSNAHAIFIAILLFCGLATYNLNRFANRGFDAYYESVGRSFASIRTLSEGSISLDEVKEDFERLAFSPRPEVPAFLLEQLNSERAEVKAWSAWALGRRKDPSLRRTVVEPLVEIVRKGPPAASTEAKIALARMQHRGIASKIEGDIQAALERGEDPDLRLLWSLANTQSASSLDILERALYSTNEEVARVAVFALAQLRESAAAPKSVKLLESRLGAAPFALRCAIIHGLGILGNENSNFAIMHGLDGAPPAERAQICPSTRMLLRPDHGGNDVHLLFISSIRNSQENLAMVALLAMGSMRATAPHVRESVEPWLESLKTNEAYPYEVRTAVDSLLNGIRHPTS